MTLMTNKIHHHEHCACHQQTAAGTDQLPLNRSRTAFCVAMRIHGGHILILPSHRNEDDLDVISGDQGRSF